MASATCSGMDAKALRETRKFYNQLFGSSLGWYNAYVHPFIYQTLCLIGVFANICIIVVLLRPQMRKNPFNLFLIAIAICDMTLMASYYIYKQVQLCHPWFFEYWWIIFTYSYAVLSVFVHSASLWMTVNMAVLRYLVLRNSATNSSMPKLNTYTAASVSIIAAVIISLIGSTPNMLRYEIRDNGMSAIPLTCLSNESSFAHYFAPGQFVHAYTLGQPIFWSCLWERLSFWTAGLMLKLIPCLLLTIFMTLLVRMLMEARERRLRLCQHGSNAAPANSTTTTPATQQKANLNESGTNNNISVKQSGPSNSSGTAERTTAMLTIIVAVFLITELPQGKKKREVLIESSYHWEHLQVRAVEWYPNLGILVMTIGVQPQLGNLIDLLSLLNSSVNFILYSTMSNLFRNEFLQTFGQLCCYLSAKVCIQKHWQLLKNPVFNSKKSRRRLINRAAVERSTCPINLSNGVSASVSLLQNKSGTTTTKKSSVLASRETVYTSNANNNLNLTDVTVNPKDGTITTVLTKTPINKHNGADPNDTYLFENSFEYSGDDEFC